MGHFFPTTPSRNEGAGKIAAGRDAATTGGGAGGVEQVSRSQRFVERRTRQGQREVQGIASEGQDPRDGDGEKGKREERGGGGGRGGGRSGGSGSSEDK